MRVARSSASVELWQSPMTAACVPLKNVLKWNGPPSTSKLTRHLVDPADLHRVPIRGRLREGVSGLGDPAALGCGGGGSGGHGPTGFRAGVKGKGARQDAKGREDAKKPLMGASQITVTALDLAHALAGAATRRGESFGNLEEFLAPRLQTSLQICSEVPKQLRIKGLTWCKFARGPPRSGLWSSRRHGSRAPDVRHRPQGATSRG